MNFANLSKQRDQIEKNQQFFRIISFPFQMDFNDLFLIRRVTREKKQIMG